MSSPGGLGQVFQVLVQDLLGALLDDVLAKLLQLLGLGPPRVVVFQPYLLAGLQPKDAEKFLSDHDSPLFDSLTAVPVADAGGLYRRRP
jgi:hypothetical protein